MVNYECYLRKTLRNISLRRVKFNHCVSVTPKLNLISDWPSSDFFLVGRKTEEYIH